MPTRSGALEVVRRTGVSPLVVAVGVVAITTRFYMLAGRSLQSASWTRSYLAIRVPDRTAEISVILGAQGTGVAEFRAIQLGLIQEIP